MVACCFHACRQACIGLAAGAVPGPLGAGSVAGWQLLMGAMGFFTYKVALVSAYVKDGVSGTGSDTDFAARKKFFEKSGRSEEL